MKRYKRSVCALMCAVLIFLHMTVPAGADAPLPEARRAAQSLSAGKIPTGPSDDRYVEGPPGSAPKGARDVMTGPIPFNPMPVFFQTDFPNVRYGSGMLDGTGCSVTCLAMVASYMTGHVYWPDQLAAWFGGKAQNNMARMEYAARELQLPFVKASTILDTFQALEEGKVAIALMNQKSHFTNSQHFIVLCGFTEDGKVLVRDPYRPNYDNWKLKNGFNYGFARSDIIQGYSGAWIFDKDALPEEPFIYYEPELDRSNPRYPDIQLSEKDLELIAKVVWVEAQGECFEGQQAVAEIVLNRMASPHFPSSANDVIYGEGQFRSVKYLKTAEPNQTQYDAIERAIYGPNILPEDVVYFGRWAYNESVWGSIGGHIFCHYE